MQQSRYIGIAKLGHFLGQFLVLLAIARCILGHCGLEIAHPHTGKNASLVIRISTAVRVAFVTELVVYSLASGDLARVKLLLSGNIWKFVEPETRKESD